MALCGSWIIIRKMTEANNILIFILLIKAPVAFMESLQWSFRQSVIEQKGFYIWSNLPPSSQSKCYLSIFDKNQQAYRKVEQCKSDLETTCSNMCSEQRFIQNHQLSYKTEFIKVEQATDGETVDKMYVIWNPLAINMVPQIETSETEKNLIQFRFQTIHTTNCDVLYGEKIYENLSFINTRENSISLYLYFQLGKIEIRCESLPKYMYNVAESSFVDLLTTYLDYEVYRTSMDNMILIHFQNDDPNSVCIFKAKNMFENENDGADNNTNCGGSNKTQKEWCISVCTDVFLTISSHWGPFINLSITRYTWSFHNKYSTVETVEPLIGHMTDIENTDRNMKYYQNELEKTLLETTKSGTECPTLPSNSPKNKFYKLFECIYEHYHETNCKEKFYISSNLNKKHEYPFDFVYSTIYVTECFHDGYGLEFSLLKEVRLGQFEISVSNIKPKSVTIMLTRTKESNLNLTCKILLKRSSDELYHIPDCVKNKLCTGYYGEEFTVKNLHSDTDYDVLVVIIQESYNPYYTSFKTAEPPSIVDVTFNPAAKEAYSVFNIILDENDKEFRCKWMISVQETNEPNTKTVLWDSSCWILDSNSTCSFYPRCNKLVKCILPDSYYLVEFKVAVVGYDDITKSSQAQVSRPNNLKYILMITLIPIAIIIILIAVALVAISHKKKSKKDDELAFI